MVKRLCNLIFCFLLLTGCTNYSYNYATPKLQKNDDIILHIDKIDIDEKVNISSIKDEVNGIVLFYEYGRPNVVNTNTIIGAHSGYGYNAYFNDIDLLNNGDKIKLQYNGTLYEYVVNDVYEVWDNEVDILNNKDYNSLTLITCKKGNSRKRIVVDAVLK